MPLNWPEAPPPPGIHDRPGDREYLHGIEVRHRYLKSADIVWHCVTAGPEDGESVIMLHGYPESWFAFHHQIAALAKCGFHVIAFDLPGFGQSDKRLDIDYDYAAIAKALAKLINAIGLIGFHLVSHDRGAVVSDHLCAEPSVNGSIGKYVRMQQSGPVPHGEPRPPHELFRSQMAIEAFRQPANVVRDAYQRNAIVAYPLDDEVELARLARELSYPGLAEAAAASFKSADFDREWEDRVSSLFPSMTMPVLFLQGAHDVGQSPNEYRTIKEFVATAELQFIDAGHFLHLENADATTAAIVSFLRFYPGRAL